MKLATPQELEEEMQVLIERELPRSDPRIVEYLARVFATAPLANLETLKWHWAGLRAEREEDPTSDFRLKLRHSRAMGDNCLVYCTFYKEETDGKSGRPGLELAELGRAGYNAAGFYASMLGEEGTAIYPRLSHRFLMIIVKVGPAIFRNYLGDMNPPQRVMLHTPHGEILLRVRYSMS